MSIKPRSNKSATKVSGATRTAAPKASIRTKKIEAKERQSKKGASTTHTQISDRWQSYLAHHRSSARDSLQRLLRTPVQTVLTMLVMAIALALPATLMVALGNVQALGERWDSGPRITLFLHTAARQAAIDKLQASVISHPYVDSVEYVSAEQALADFESESGMGSALRSLDNNPLPAAIMIKPKALLAPELLDELAVELQQQAIVEDVLYDQAWIKRLYEILNLGERLVLSLAGLLVVGVILVVGNTIRLAIENRRDEIVIVKLVGGTDAFVRRPFLYTGFWYGFGGGLLACVLLILGLHGLSQPVSELAGLYQSDFRLQGLGFSSSMGLILVAATIGWLGSWLTVGRQLSEIHPE